MASTRGRTAALIGGVGVAAVLGISSAGSTAAQSAPSGASSYLNGDPGKPTENASIRSGSSCTSPDASDTQAVGDPATGKGNVHNDACLTDASGAAVDTSATFESTGVGGVFGCPDPDMAGPKTSAKHDHDADGRAEHCHLSGFEAANSEYHTRLVSAEAGTQTVTFCADDITAEDGAGAPAGHGCADATARGSVRITWAPAGGAATGEAPADPAQTGRVAAGVLAGLLAAGTGAVALSAARARA